MEFDLNCVSTKLVLVFFLISLVKVCFIITYWKRKGIPSLIQYTTATISNIFSIYSGKRLQICYNIIKSKRLKHAGVIEFFSPVYIPISPDLLKFILQKDFNYFTEKGFYYNEKLDPLSANLFALGGERWKYIRTKLSSSFTITKTKFLLDSLIQCGIQMQTTVEEFLQLGAAIKIKDIATCYTIDIIGSCVYGLACNSFRNTTSEFRTQGKKIFVVSKAKLLSILLCSYFPLLGKLFGVTVFTRQTRDFFVNIVKDTVKYRKDNRITRNDILQSLMKLLDKDENGNCLTIEQISGQAFVFFAAGFETSSTTIAFCLYELSRNTSIQDKVRSEIFSKLKGDLNYDVIMEMCYLDQVIDETLRKYPPVSFLTRVSTKDYKLPDTDSILPKGTLVAISILGLHSDPEYFPDPENFDPDRFSPERRQDIKPYTYLPFGEGPRICIGLKFGILQVKVGLISLLSRYKFILNSKTEEPLKMNPLSFTMIPKNEIYLDVQRAT